MAYKVVLTQRFSSDVDNVYAYLNNEFKLISSLKDFDKKIKEAIANLEIMPEAFLSLKKHGFENLRGYRCKNYLIIYEVIDDCVYLYALVYAKSDIKNRLKDPSNE